MASQEPIEKLYVKLEADVRDLLTEGEKAIKQLEKRMDDLDNKGKQAGRFTQFKAGLNKLVRSIRAAQAAVIAFGAALVAAFRLAQEAVADLRIERSFYSLANAAEQSGGRILKAMQEASRGAIDDLTLMQQANLAMQLGVARTPEEFDKLTKSAIALGAAVGRGPVEALNDLIVAAGRRSRLVLDNLGLSLGEVNRLMDEFARVEFGKTVDQLSQIQRDMLFTRATIEAANRKAAQLGGNLEDAGTSMDSLAAQSKNLRSELGQTALVFFNLLNGMEEGPTILQRLKQGAEAWQITLIHIAALVMTIRDGLAQGIKNMGQMANVAATLAEMPLPELIRYISSGEFSQDFNQASAERVNFGETLTENLNALFDRFQDIIDPEAAAITVPGPEIDPDPTEESADEIRDILNSLTTDMIDASEERQDALEDLEREHNDRMADIAAEGARQRARIEQSYQDDLEDLARETEERRAEIFRDTQRDLEDLARDTNEALEDEREDFQTEERRDTEDHLRDMRRLTADYLFDLEDAVRARDARAVVDLQRRFAMESQRREEDFNVSQGRRQEDLDQRLAEIRENEARRRDEILRNQAQELQDLMAHEAQRRTEIDASYNQQVARLNEQMAESRARENENYAERKADLEAALKERLEAIAKELADEEKINEDGARRILSKLKDFFGVGGEIDDLMEDFVRRRRQTMRVEVSFEGSTELPEGGNDYDPAVYGGGFPAFQHGGTLLARKPTLAMFGEAGPEVAQFTPLSQMGRGGQPQRLQIEFSGSAPPGIRSTERDQIAAVLLNALRDTGMMG